MNHVATLHFSEALVRSAVLSFWKRSIGWKFVIAIAICGASLAFLILSGDRSWRVGITGAVLAFGIGLGALLYFVHLRNSLTKLRSMKEPVGTFKAETDSYTVSSDLGSSTVVWSTIQEIWKFETYWLLLLSRAQFMTLPLADVPEEMQACIQERVAASRTPHVIDP
jgi:hypothetical protein